MKRGLPTAGPTALGAPTIMDRALAQDHGADYVRLAAFAIDLDRLYLQLERARASDPSGQGAGTPRERPFGWEVFVLECYLLGALDSGDPRTLRMIEDACLSVLEQPPDQARLGSHLVFAVYDAVERRALPEELGVVFHRWRSPPTTLCEELADAWGAPRDRLAQLATGCLEQSLEPPVSPTTRAALERMVARDWSVGALS